MQQPGWARGQVARTHHTHPEGITWLPARRRLISSWTSMHETALPFRRMNTSSYLTSVTGRSLLPVLVCRTSYQYGFVSAITILEGRALPILHDLSQRTVEEGVSCMLLENRMDVYMPNFIKVARPSYLHSCLPLRTDTNRFGDCATSA